MEKWFVMNKRADFTRLGELFGISPVTARLIRNRGMETDDDFKRYLNGTANDLYDPHLLKDAELLVKILKQKIKEGKKLRIIGDYDIDGVMSTYILLRGTEKCGGLVSVFIPDRMKDGYGMNESMIERAKLDGVDTIITCDNGISALPEIALAKSLGMTVLVTDHHEIPFTEENGKKRYLRSEADAIVNPKQKDCEYPFKELCGAAVAFKVIQLLYEACGFSMKDAYEFFENVAFATVGDLVDLTGENRILAREGIKAVRQTQNPGMKALILKNGLSPEQIGSYHFGYVLGPCVNAGGRLETAQTALALFLEKDSQKAEVIAERLVELNQQRKALTFEGQEAACKAAEETCAGDKVLSIYLPNVHESLAGIIAGRVREIFHKPVFVLTNGENGIKGSGRSIETYSMYEEMCKCRELFSKFGGHPMAAGLTLKCGGDENGSKALEAEDYAAYAEEFRKKINACCSLTEEDLAPRIKADMAMPADYADAELIREFDLLEPYGKENVKPQFADRNLSVERAYVVGKNRNVLKIHLKSEQGRSVCAVYFGDIEKLKRYYSEKYGASEVEQAFLGRKNKIQMSIIYYPEINEYNGMESIQIVIRNYQ